MRSRAASLSPLKDASDSCGASVGSKVSPSRWRLAAFFSVAETWARNWNFGGHTVDSRFTSDYGYWNYTETTYEPWLFDRATVGHRLYELTGNTRWRDQFLSDFAWYRAHIDAQGIFTPKGSGDTKYGYGMDLVAPQDIEILTNCFNDMKITKDGSTRHLIVDFLDRKKAIHRVSLNVTVIPGTSRIIASFDQISDERLQGDTADLDFLQIAGVINNIPDATFAIDRNGKVIAWNRALEELTVLIHSTSLERAALNILSHSSINAGR